MKWIKITEQLPPECGWVLVGGINVNGNWLVTTARITCGGNKEWSWFNHDEDIIDVPYSDGTWGPLNISEITHWMDLPPCPDEDIYENLS